MTSAKRRKKRRRRKIGPDSPMQGVGSVLVDVEVPGRFGWMSRPLAGLVALLPAYEQSDRGRAWANVVRLGLGGIAVLLVSQGTVVMGALGAAVALKTIFIPVTESRKRRLLERARRVGAPRAEPTPTPATFTFDGKKITIRCQDRVWRSMRPRNPPARLRVVEDGERWLLGLSQAGRKPHQQLWFAARRDAIGETYDPVQLDSGPGPDNPLVVEGEDWALLHEVLSDPKAP